jgi:hypothetical protein
VEGQVENETTHRPIRRDASKQPGVFRPVGGLYGSLGLIFGASSMACSDKLQLKPNMHSEGDCTIISDNP